jgi:hypothetical protein
MPAEDPSICSHLCVADQATFFRLLRPELVQIFKTKFPKELLHPDSLTPFIRQGTEDEQKQYNERASKATQLLLEQVQTFATELSKLETAELFQNWSSELHKRGINVRHQGLLRSLVQKETKQGTSKRNVT